MEGNGKEADNANMHTSVQPYFIENNIHRQQRKYKAMQHSISNIIPMEFTQTQESKESERMQIQSEYQSILKSVHRNKRKPTNSEHNL